jgi:hypothetical protein
MGSPRSVLALIATSGLLSVAFLAIVDFASGGINVTFKGPLPGGGYLFSLHNDSNAAQQLVTFHVVPASGSHEVVATTTQPVVGSLGARGLTLPDGNTNSAPAFSYSASDGLEIAKDASLDVRIPPLIAETWLRPDAMDVDINFDAVPNNPLLRGVDEILGLLRIRRSSHTLHYAVLNNYWVEVGSFDESAIQRACDENDHVRRSAICAVKILH